MQQSLRVRSRTTRTTDDPAQQFLADIATVGPAISARSGEIEAARRIPQDIIDILKDIGAFRMFSPRATGGLELPVPESLEILTALARIDASVAWCIVTAAGQKVMLQKMPLEDQAAFKLDGPDVILAGSVQPVGRAEREADRWRISGRWPFASGCDHADWITGFCLVMENGQPLPAPNGAPGPMIRTVVLPKAEWQIEDTWHAAGLKGTGSHHVVLENKLVPPELFIDAPMGPARVPGPLYKNAFTVAPIALTPIAVGIAEGALSDVIELAKTGRQQVRAAAPMRESEVFQLDLGRAAAEIDGARAMMRSRAAEFWDLLLADAPIGEAHAIRALQTAAWILETATRAVDICYTLGGGSAVYETSPLQRRLRDIHAIAGHVFVQRRHYASAGKLLLQDE